MSALKCFAIFFSLLYLKTAFPQQKILARKDTLSIKEIDSLWISNVATEMNKSPCDTVVLTWTSQNQKGIFRKFIKKSWNC